jgi:hypothetical protein
MRNRVLLTLAILAVAISARSELRNSTFTATGLSQTITVNAGEVFIVNDDSTNSIYVRIFESDETPAAATTSNFEIKKAEGFTFSRPGGIKAISIVTASAAVAGRLSYW